MTALEPLPWGYWSPAEAEDAGAMYQAYIVLNDGG
jgi:hypothetical protein